MGQPKHILKSLDKGSVRLINENFRKVSDELTIANFAGNTITIDSSTNTSNTSGNIDLVIGDATNKLWLNNTNDGVLALGGTTKASAPFRVTSAGALTATSADITGTVTATGGSIGGWTIGSDSLTSASGNVGMSSAVTAGDDVRFWAGSSDKDTAPYRVTELGKVYAKDFISSLREIVVEPGESLQAAINELAATGGQIKLTSGLHTMTEDIYIKSKIYITGTGQGTYLDFGGTYNMYAVGENAYSAGTVSVTTGSTTVTGSGTTWLTNAAAGQYIKLGSSYIMIIEVVSDTELTLELAYAGATITNGQYVLATTLYDSELRYVTLVNLADRFLIQYGQKMYIEVVYIANSGGSGLSILDSANCTVETTHIVGTVSSPVVSNTGLTEFNTCGFIASGGSGVEIINTSDCSFSNTYNYGNTVDGMTLSGCTNISINGTIFGNGANGISVANGSATLIGSTALYSNTDSGVNIDSSESTLVMSDAIYGNNYGIKISSTSVDTCVSGCSLHDNVTQDILDYSADAVIDNNVGDGLPFKKGDSTWQVYWDGTYAGIKGNIVCNTPILLAGYLDASLPVPPSSEGFNSPGGTA